MNKTVNEPNSEINIYKLLQVLLLFQPVRKKRISRNAKFLKRRKVKRMSLLRRSEGCREESDLEGPVKITHSS